MRRRVHHWQDDGSWDEVTWADDEENYSSYPVLDNDELWEEFKNAESMVSRLSHQIWKQMQRNVPLNDEEKAELVERRRREALSDAEYEAESLAEESSKSA